MPPYSLSLPTGLVRNQMIARHSKERTENA